MTNHFASADKQPTPNSPDWKGSRRWLGAALGLIVALTVVGLTLASLSISSRADETLAPSTRVLISSSQEEDTDIAPDQEVVYTFTVQNRAYSSDDDAVSGTLISQIPSPLQIVSVNPPTITQSVVPTATILNWDTGPIPHQQESDFVVVARLPAIQNVMHSLLFHYAVATLYNADGESHSDDDEFTHYVQNADNAIIPVTAIAVGTAPIYNDVDEVVAGERITITVVSTVPQGTLAYTYTPRILLGDGISQTGAIPTPTSVIVDQGLLDPAHVAGRFTQVEFAPLTITDTDGAPQVLTYTLFALARQHYFLGSEAGQEIEDGTDLFVQPIARWCAGPGCSVVPTDTAHVKADETNSIELIRPDVQPDVSHANFDHTYQDAAGVGQGNGQVTFGIPVRNQSGDPIAYDIVLTATLGPGLTFYSASDGGVSNPPYISWTLPAPLASGQRETVYLTATLPPTFIVGTEFSYTVDILHETFLGDVPYEGEYVNHLTDNPDYPDGYTIMPGVGHVKAAWPNDDVTIGDTVYYTVVTTVGAGTFLDSPWYTDTLPAGFHYVSDTFNLEGATLVEGPFVAPGPIDNDDAVLQTMHWRIADVDQLAGDTRFFTATYRATLTGLDADSPPKPVYGGDADGDNDYRDVRSRKDADNSANLTFTGMPTTLVYVEAAVGAIDVYQPYMGTEGTGGLFNTSRVGAGNVTIGDSVYFKTEFKNNAAGDVNAYEVQICNTLPPGLAFEQTIAFAPPAGCPDAAIISGPAQGDQGTICWTLNKACAGVAFQGTNALDYESIVLPSVIPGMALFNQAQLSDYSSQAGDANPYDRHYMDFPEAMPPTIQCGAPGCPFTVLGLAGSKRAGRTSVRPDDLITYTLAYTDTQPDIDYAGLIISDVYDANLVFVDATLPYTLYDPVARLLVWDIGDVPHNSGGQIILTMQVLENVANAFQITNTMIWDWDDNPVDPLQWVETTQLLATDLHLQMTGPFTTHAGSEINYTLTYSNVGNITLPVTLTLDYGPYLTFDAYDDTYAQLITGTTNLFVDTGLPNDGTPHTLIISLTTKAPLPYTLSQIDSSAVIESAGAIPVTDDWTIALERPILTLEKTGPDVPAGESLPMDYEIDIANAGTYTATGLVLTETWDANTHYAPANDGAGWTNHGDYATYQAGQLGIGETHPTIHFLAIVDTAVVSYGNTIYLASDQTTAQSDRAEVWQESIRTTKTVSPDPAWPGRPLTYTIYYTNTGGAVTNAVITDYLPSGVEYASCSSPDPNNNCQAPGWTCGQAGNDVVWQCASLLANRSGELILVGTVTAEENDWLVNETGSNGDHPTPFRPIDEPVRTRVGRPHLGIRKSDADVGPVAPGDLITYTLVYSNYDGTDSAYDVYIHDPLSELVSYVDGSCMPTATCSYDAVEHRLTWHFDEVPTGTLDSTHFVAQASDNACRTAYNLNYTIESGPPPGGAAVQYIEPLTNDPVGTWILEPSLTLFAEAQPDIVFAVNEYVTYTLTYYNNGGGMLTNVVITDELPPQVSIVDSQIPANCGHTGEGFGGTLTCTVGSLVRQQSGTIKVLVQNGALSDMIITHYAQATGVVKGTGDRLEATSNPASYAVDVAPVESCQPVRFIDFRSDSPAHAGEPMHFVAIPQETRVNAVTYVWTFGDGRSETRINDPTIEHNYAVGSYEVTLEVSDACSPTHVISVTHSNLVTCGDLPPSEAAYAIYLPIIIKND